MKATKPDGRWQQPTGISPLHFSCSPTHCLRRSERSDFDSKGVSACRYVMARKQLRLHYGVVMIAPLFREKHRGAPTVRLDTDSNVSVCPMMHRHCPAGFLCQRTRKGTVWKGEQHTMPTLNQVKSKSRIAIISFASRRLRSSSSTCRRG